MKYLILITSILVSLPTLTMEQPSVAQAMRTRIAKNAKGHPSITFINDTPFSISMKIGDLEKDQIQSRMHLPKDTHLTLSPYSHPFNLKKEENIQPETIIPLIVNIPDTKEEKKPTFNFHIGGESSHEKYIDIKFEDRIRINYENNDLNVILDTPHPQNKTNIKRKTDIVLPKNLSKKSPSRADTF